MKQTLLISFLLFFVLACSNNDKNAKDVAENDLDAARNFIQAALNGDYDLAKKYMLQDSVNLEDLNTAMRLSERSSPDEKRKYRESSIRIHNHRVINDSTSIISFSNSYKQRIDSLLLVNDGGRWVVDFKFIFQHQKDSLP